MGSPESATASRHGNGTTSGVGDVVGEILRNAAGEAVKGGASLSETTKRVVVESVETLEQRGPVLVQDAGIMTWRYALLGWATWKVGKFVVKRRLRKTAGDDEQDEPVGPRRRSRSRGPRDSNRNGGRSREE